MPQLPLLPRPRQMEEHEGTFLLDSGMPIQLVPDAGDATVRTAEGLVAGLNQHLGVELPLRPTGSPSSDVAISLILAGRDDYVFPTDIFEWTWTGELGEQGYRLIVSPERVIVVAGAEAGLFYGVQTLIQIAKATGRSWPCLEISDSPVLPVRGLMLDVSRMKVPRLETLEEMVRTLAHYKYNQFQLYIEHTYDFPRHPEIGAGASPITAAEVIRLDRLCRELHIELVPNLQSLGHQRTMLEHPRYAHLAETEWRWSLATAREETFELLDELYGDMLPAFSSRWLNADADEPSDYGRGQSAALTEREGIDQVYLYHIKRLRDLAARHGRKLMMWADVLKYHPELAEDLPDDILLLDWWYEPLERYDSVDRLAAAKRRFYICPGTSSWSALFPRLDNAVTNVQTFVRDGVEAGAEGMVMTDWGDGGHYQQLSHSWYPYLWAAECGWTGSETAPEEFQQALSLQFYGDASGALAKALYRLGCAMSNNPNWMMTWNTAMALWEEPLTGPVAGFAPAEVTAEAKAAAEALSPYLGQIADDGIRHDLAFTIYQICFAVDKVETTRRIRALLGQIGDATGPKEETLAELDRLIGTMRRHRRALPGMVSEFRGRWIEQAKRSEIRVNLQRYDKLIARYDAALEWLTVQRTAYAAGEPVDADLSMYDDGGYAVLYQESRRNLNRLVEIVGYDALPPDVKSWISRMDLESDDARLATANS